MIVDNDTKKRLSDTFKALNSTRAARTFPAPASLSGQLGSLIPSHSSLTVDIEPDVAARVCTAAVDMWLRAVHSLLISASLTQASPIWASVTGYYSSHYVIRGLAHLLGRFQLFRRKKIATTKFVNNNYVCSYSDKGAKDAEHKLYWRIIRESDAFRDDPLFSSLEADGETPDVKHRNFANYADHVFDYPDFKPLSEEVLRGRIERLSTIEFIDPPHPKIERYPDLDSVQLLAYHRIVVFRRFLDEAIGTKNKFWSLHRNPDFASKYLDFQLVTGRMSDRAT
jgi:hypothetical protein